MNEKSFEIRRRSKSFFWASVFFSKNERKDINTLYSFCRYVDDISDNKNPNRRNARGKHHKIINELQTRSSKNPIVSNFIDLLLKYTIDTYIPIQLVKGVLQDLEVVNIKNLEQLLIYSFRVAGTVGLMMCSIMRVKDKNLLNHAIELGIAMQITNIVRDVKEDLLRDRIYVPEIYRKFKFINSDELLKDHEKQIELSRSILMMIEYSNKLYESSSEGILGLPFKYRLPILIASNLYQNIGQKIKNNPLKIWTERVYVRNNHKILLTLFSFFKCFTFKFGKKKIRKNHEIHKILKDNLNKNE